MSYVDGFVLAVPSAKKDAYRDLCTLAGTIFKDHGATRVVECWGDEVPDGKVTDFRRAVQAAEGEVVVFSWIEWPSKEARDAGMKASMDDPRMSKQENEVFDGKRMIYGGFVPLIDR